MGDILRSEAALADFQAPKNAIIDIRTVQHCLRK
jgi:hypothetical protein